MIIITGIGRSGTSFMALYLQNLGFDMGSNKWFDRVNAGLENRHTININQRLIQHYVKLELQNIWHIRGDIAELNYDAVKDPQFLMHPKIMEEWARVRDDLKVIVMHRDFNDIAASQKRVPEWTCPAYRCFPDLMEIKYLEFIGTLQQLQIEHIIINYPDDLKDPDIFVNKIKGFITDYECDNLADMLAGTVALQ